jgi:hypothetical protein
MDAPHNTHYHDISVPRVCLNRPEGSIYRSWTCINSAAHDLTRHYIGRMDHENLSGLQHSICFLSCLCLSLFD